jgi:hypothetical protein
MYYNNLKQKYVSDSLLITDKDHKQNKGYKSDKLDYQCYTYKSNDEFESDLFKIKEEAFIATKNPFLEYRIEFLSKPHIDKKMYEEEHQTTKNYGDINFYDWLSKQTDPKVAVFAELVNAPKLHNSIEKMRDELNSIGTISIQEYAKIKKLGSRSVTRIKELKKKYGNSILKFLYLSVS